MGRPQLHASDTILDVARDLALMRGAGAATVKAIAAASGAPTGSLYHRFGSQADLLGRVWARAARHSQEAWLIALRDPDPRRAAIGGALAIHDFCQRETADARLLVSFRREDLLRAEPSPQLARELVALNRPVEQAIAELAARLYGTARLRARQQTALVAIDLPYGAVRRYLIENRRLPAALRGQIEAAVGGVLNARTTRG